MNLMYMLQAETHFLTAPVPFHEHDVSVHQNIFLILILRCFYPVRYLFTLFYPLIPVSHIPAFFLIQQCRISGKIRGIVCMRHSVIDHGRADLVQPYFTNPELTSLHLADSLFIFSEILFFLFTFCDLYITLISCFCRHDL